MRGRTYGRSRARWRSALLGVFWLSLLAPAEALGRAPPELTEPGSTPVGPPGPPPDPPAGGPPRSPPGDGPAGPGTEGDTTPAPPAGPEPGAVHPEPSWVDSQRLVVGRGLGTLIDRFDRFFGDDRQLDLESPSTRFRLKSFGRTDQDRGFTWGVAAVVAVRLPRLERILGNARLILVGENTGAGVRPPAPGAPSAGEPPPLPINEVGATDPSRGGGRAEVRFDVVRQGLLVFDTGAGVTLAWPSVVFARFRAHARVALGAGFVLRATEELFVELGGLGFGESTNLLVERFIGSTARLRWEGHGISAQRTRGVEWSTLVGAEWKPHRLTGLNAGVGAYGFGTPEPSLDTWRTWIGVRQDLHRGWVFLELEPEVGWPRRAGEPRRQVLAVTLRLEVMIEGRPAVVGAADAGH